MALLNFVETLEIMAYNVNSDEEQHHHFGRDAQLIVDAIIKQLKNNNSLFKEYLSELRTTASFVSEINLDLPLAFEVFLPLRLPIALNADFNESKRSVQFSKRKCSYPFFFGNMLNAKCMNILLQRDLELAISQLSSSVANYFVKYSAMSFNRAPFAHQVFAMERGSIDRGIHFDFILALEFDGAAMPLPSYYNAPISYKWLAYGLIPVSADSNSSDWGILLPWWQNADHTVQRRSHNMLLLLYRLLYVQRCFGFAVPFLLKLCFFMATADVGENYMDMGVAELMITTFGHQVFRNFRDLIAASNPGDPLTKLFCTISMGQLQAHGKDIFAVLAKGFQRNVISSELIKRFFQIDYVPDAKEDKVKAEDEKQKDDTKENDKQQEELQLIEASSSRKRRRSI